MQLHAAHDYLLSQFLSPYQNRRKDRWGGSIANRFRMMAAIIQGARQRVGDYSIWVKISAHDGHRNGMRVEEAIEIARMLQDVGCDAIEMSCGSGPGFDSIRVAKIPVEEAFKLVPWYKNMSPLKKRLSALVAPLVFKKHRPPYNYNVAAASRIKEHVDVPVIAVGGTRRMKDMEEVVRENKADYVALFRPLIIEPNIVARFRDGKRDESRCMDCGYCLLGVTANRLKCYYGRVPD